MSADAYERCLSILNSLGEISLRFRPKSHEPVEAFRAAMELAQSLSQEDIARLRGELGESMSLRLMYLSTLAAERAMNTREVHWLGAALMGHVVEGFLLDPRENYLRLYAVEYAAHRASLDLRASVRRLKSLMDKSVAENFANAFSVRLGERALMAADLAIETDPDGEIRFAPRR